MKIKFETVLVDADDKIVMEGNAPAAVRDLLKRAVLADAAPDTEKLSRFELFLKLRQADSDTDFSLDEVQLLVKAVRAFPTLIMGQLTYLLTK
jgi:hypothetical protein